MKQPPSEPPRWPPRWWRRVHPLALAGAALIVIVGPVLFLVAVLTEGVWAWVASLGSVALGLMLIVQALMPDRNVHGTKVWQNDGLPGGGGAGG